MRITVILIFVISFGALLGVTVLRTEESLVLERTSGVNGFLEGQTAAVVPAMDGEVRVLTGTLILGLQGLLAESKTEFDLSKPYSRFLMMAQLAPGENGEWKIPAPVFREATAVKPWAVSYSQLALKGVQEAQFIRGSVQFYALLDPQRTPHLLMVHRTGKDEWYAGIIAADTFQPIIDRLRLAGSEAFVVNRNGQVIAHSSAEYVASLLTENPVVKDLLAAGKVKSSIDHGRGTKRQRSIYEQIPTTNLYIVVSSSLFFGEAFTANVVTPLLSFGVGIFFAGLALLLLFDRPPKMVAPVMARMPASDFQTLAKPGSKAAPVPTPAKVAPKPAMPIPAPAIMAAPAGVPAAPAPTIDRMEIFKASASAMAHEMRTPVLGILAQLQQIRSKHPEIGSELDRIEKYAREGRMSIEKIFSFAGENIEEKSLPVNPVDEVLGALQRHQALIGKKDISVEKDTQAVTALRGSPSLLQKAFAHVIENAVEAMEKSPTKKLKISVKENDGFVDVRFQDTGEGISPADASKVFDPFFSTKKAKGSFGLGLSTAFSIARNFGGELILESTEQQKGTSLLFRFPVVNLEAAGPSAAVVLSPPVGIPEVAAPPSVAPIAATPLKAPPSAPRKPVIEQSVKKPMPEPTNRPSKDLIAQDAVDRTMKMIDQLDPLPPAPPKDEFETLELTATAATSVPPQTNAVEPAQPAIPPPGPGPKAPQIKVDAPKKTTQTLKFNVRRPGDKS